jgi:hypothetical protein
MGMKQGKRSGLGGYIADGGHAVPWCPMFGGWPPFVLFVGREGGPFRTREAGLWTDKSCCVRLSGERSKVA